jgi:hypothetical protein
MQASGPKLLAASGADGMEPKDVERLYDCAIDVVSLPGMYQATDMADMDAAERLTSVMSVALGKDRRSRGDHLWRTTGRNALGTIRTKDDFMLLVGRITDYKDAAFRRQDEGMRLVLDKAGYKDSEAKEFLKSGGLPRLIQDTYTFYMELLMHIQRMAVNSQGSWKDSQAGALTQYHSDKLLSLRNGASHRRSFLLSTYTYLRDSRTQKFTDVSMVAKLWKRLDEDSSNNSPKNPEGHANTPADAKDQKEATCSHCRSPALHVLFKRPVIRVRCPLADHSSQLARKAAPGLMRLKLDRPQDQMTDLIKDAIQAVS